jgi:Helix-turn-helix domain
MVTAAATSTNNKPRSRRSWSPDGDDHLIFQWVKMEGKTQGWAASQLGISQATVSRIVQRYERWQAHAKEREEGRLDHAERLRAQRWLTFERNELILASCLRIAGAMEGFVDTSKSTIRRPLDNPNHESEVRTESSAIDRSGVAARFLRLAFRINMEQLKLAQLEEPPPAQSLSAEEILDQERQATADTQEIAQARQRTVEEFDAAQRKQQEREDERERWRRIEEGERLELAKEHAQAKLPEADETEQAQAESTPAEPSAPPAAADASLYNLHNVHNENTSEIGATAAEPYSCVPQPGERKNSNSACIDGRYKRSPDDARPKGAKRRRAAAVAR